MVASTPLCLGVDTLGPITKSAIESAAGDRRADGGCCEDDGGSCCCCCCGDGCTTAALMLLTPLLLLRLPTDGLEVEEKWPPPRPQTTRR